MTDQWREVVQWLGQFWSKVFLCGSPPRLTSIGEKDVFEVFSKENNGFGKLIEKLMAFWLKTRWEFKAFLYTYKTRLKLEKFSELEVGMF